MAGLRDVGDVERAAGPTVPWLCAGFLLTGLGTVLMGPILPSLAAAWHLRDADAGLLLAAKFTGSFVGGISVPKRLRFGILIGMAACLAGFAAFAMSAGLASGAAALFVAGFGLGEIIASTNILIGLRFREHTGAALAATNFFWSLGAVLTGVTVAALVPHVGLMRFLFGFAAMFAVVGAGGRFAWVRGDTAPGEDESATGTRELIVFGLMLFLYGGLETSLTQWITTFTVRYGAGWAQSPIVVLWSSLTVGRLMTTALLRRWREGVVRLLSLAVSVVLLLALAFARTAAEIIAVSVVLGLALAPFFPATFALLMGKRPTARAAGTVLAVSGLGAAALSWMVGAVSTGSGSLRVGMLVPLAAAVGLFGLSAWQRPPSARSSQ